MNLIIVAAPALSAAILSFCFVAPVRALAFRIGAIDLPGPRKIHKQPMPRLGGVAVVAASAVVCVAVEGFKARSAHFLSARVLTAIATGLLPVLLISFIDDVRSVRASTKLFMHCVGAGIAVIGGVVLTGPVAVFGRHIHLGWLSVPLSLFWIVCVTNAFNIIDGLDGLSAGLALISSISLAAVSFLTGQYGTACVSLILAGSLVGFLPHNVYPARIFLGDTGATAIGFVLACLTLGRGSVQSGTLAVALPFLIVGVPLADTAISVVRRFVARFDGASKSVFEADSRHIHHRLLALGLDQRHAALTLYIAGAVLALTALLSLFMAQRKAALLLVAILTAAFIGIFKLGYDEFAVWRRESLLKIYNAPVLRIGLFIAFIDIGLVIVAIYASIVLKYDDWTISAQRLLTRQLLVLLPGLTVAVFGVMRVYRCSWRNPNIQDVLKLATATLTASFVSFIVASMVLDSALTVTLFVVYTMTLLALTTAARISYHVLCYWRRRANREGEPVVIYGAGNSGTLALRRMQANDAVPMIPVGFIDDDPVKRGRWVNGYPVLGSITSLEEIVTSRGIRGVVIASEKMEISKLHHAQSMCKDAGLWLRRFHVGFQDDLFDQLLPQATGGVKRRMHTANKEL